MGRSGRIEKTVEAHRGAVLAGQWSHDGAGLVTGEYFLPPLGQEDRLLIFIAHFHACLILLLSFVYIIKYFVSKSLVIDCGIIICKRCVYTSLL